MIDLSQLPRMEAQQPAAPTEQREIPLTNDQEYNEGLKAFAQMRDNDPGKMKLSDSLQSYRDNKIFLNGVDPAERLDESKRRENLSFAANLMRDWVKYPEAREAVVKMKGEDFAKGFELMREDEKQSARLNEIVAATTGTDDMAMLRYCEQFHVQEMSPNGIRKHFNEAYVTPMDKDMDARKSGREIAYDSMIGELATGEKSAYDEYSDEGRYATATRQAAKDDFDSAKFTMGLLNKIFSENDVLPNDQDNTFRDYVRHGSVSRYEVEQILAKLKRENERAYGLVMGALNAQAEKGRKENIPFLGTAVTKPVRGMKATILGGRKLLGVDNIMDTDLADKEQIDLMNREKEIEELLKNVSERDAKIIRENIRMRFVSNKPGVASPWSIDRSVAAMGDMISEESKGILRKGLELQDFRRGLYNDFYTLQAQTATALDSLSETANKIREDAGRFWEVADLIGGAAGDTATFISSAGMNTFSDIAGRKFNEYRVNHSANESFWRACPYGAAEVAAESIAFGKVGKAATWGFMKIPFAGKAVGKAADYLKIGQTLSKLEVEIAKRPALRYGYETAVGGSFEFMEEFLSPTLAMPIDLAIARLYGSTDAPTLADWKKEMGDTLSADTAISMYGFAAMMGGLNIRGMRRDARDLSMNKDALMALGVPGETAEKIVNMTGIQERVMETRKTLAGVDALRENTRKTITEGLNNLSVLELTPDGGILQSMMDLGEIDRFQRNEDGSFTVTRRDNGEVLRMDDKAAADLMVSQLDGNALVRIAEAQDLIAKNALVDQMKEDGVIFEKMNTEGETVETILALAGRANLLIEEGADPSTLDASISENVPLGMWEGIAANLAEREKIAQEQGDIGVLEKGISNAYRIRLEDGKTVIRFAEGKATFLDILEEQIETNFARDLENSRDIDWYINNVRTSQEWLLQNGYLEAPLISAEGEVSHLALTEAMSKLAQGVAMNEAALRSMPEPVGFFIRLLRGLVDAALNLAKLGKALQVGAQNGYINEDFTRQLYDLAGVGAEYFNRIAEKSERNAKDVAREAAKKIDASFTIKGKSRAEIIAEMENDPAKKRVFDMVDEILRRDGNVDGMTEVIYRPVNEREIKDIKQESGIDVSGMDHVFKPDSITHMIRRHGKDSGKQRGQRDLEVEDMKMLPDVLDNYDSLSVDNSGANNSVVRYRKKYPSGEVVFLERIIETSNRRSKKPRLSSRTAWVESQQGSNALAGKPVYTPVRYSKESKTEEEGNVKTDNDSSFSIGSGGYDFNLEQWENRRNKAMTEYWKRFDKELKGIVSEARTMEGRADGGDFAARLHANLGVVRAAIAYLPERLKGNINPFVSRLEMLAEMAATGRISVTGRINASARRELRREAQEAVQEGMDSPDVQAAIGGAAYEGGGTQKAYAEAYRSEAEEIRKAWAEGKANEVMTDLIRKVDEQLEGYVKGKIRERIDRIIESTRPKKGKSGKFNKGKLGIDAQRQLDEVIIPAMNMSAEEKEAATNQALGEMSAVMDETSTTGTMERMAELNNEITALTIYGNLDGQSVDEMGTALNSLERFVKSGKQAWEAAEDARKERYKKFSRMIVSTFNKTGKKVSPNALRKAEEEAGNVIRSSKQAGDVFESLSQFMERLKKYDGTRDFAEELQKRMVNSYSDLKSSRKKRNKKVNELYSKILTDKVLGRDGVKNIREWIGEFKKTRNTGISLIEIRYENVKMPIAEARMWVGMTKEERQKQRDLTEDNSPTEKAVDEIRKYLEEYDASFEKAESGEGKKPRPKKYVELSVSHGNESEMNLEMSKDNALYIILQYEQEDLRETLEQQGYTPDVIEKLRKFVGGEGMAIGYGLRGMFEDQRQKISPKYEEVMGVPFPSVPNYYAARWVAYDKMSDTDAMQMLSGTPTLMGGNNNGWQILRTKHNRRVDTSISALEVFFDGTDQTDNWFYTYDLVSDLRGILGDKATAESLVANIGKDDFARLKAWMGLMEKSGQDQGKSHGSISRVIQLLYAGSSKAILAFRVETMIRQASAVMNAWAGDPTISLTEWLATILHVKNGDGKMTIGKMFRSDIFQDRRRKDGDLAERVSRLGNDDSFSTAERIITYGMNGIENVDVFLNAVGSSSLWNIYYKRGIDAGMTETEAEAQAWDSVKRGLAMSAQPQEWQEKTFGGIKMDTFSRAMYYMMSENFNKVGLIYGYWAGGKKGKAAKVWLAYGALNALIGAILDLMKDDEKQRKKRSLRGYIAAALFGPLSGTPIVGEGLEFLIKKAFGADVYTGSTGRAIVDLEGGWKAGENLYTMISGNKSYGFDDYVREIAKTGRLFGTVGGYVGTKFGDSLVLVSALMNPVKTTINATDAAGVTKKDKIKK